MTKLILYLLALADTIESIKVYNRTGLSDIEIWNGILINIGSDKIDIKIADSRMPFELFRKK